MRHIKGAARLAAVVAGALAAGCNGGGGVAAGRAQQDVARDALDIQNLMSRRALYHSVGQNERELELWSAKQEIRWGQNQGCWIGEDFRKYYVTLNMAMQKAQLAALSKSNPAIANNFEKNRAIGSSIYHILTTPIIEIAQDGQSAKGFWYTPGALLMSPDGKTAQGVNMWERYGGDFIREDGAWRILHLEVITDFAYPFGGDLGTPPPGAPDPAKQGNEGEASAPGPGAEGLEVPPPTIRRALGESYSPTRVPKLTPRLPEPYTTLAETFEYAACNPNFSPVTSAVDKDRDGRMSTSEWQAAKLPESSFKMFEKGRGFVTQQDYDRNAAPDGLDLNGDGRLTVEEFVEFDRQMSAKMKSGQGPPPGPPRP